MKLSRLKNALAASLILLTTTVNAQENISVPKPQNEYDRFAQRILNKALRQSQYAFNTREFDRELSQPGLVESLRHQDIDVAWLPANSAMKKEFTAIKIPIFKGALSYYQIQSNDQQLQSLSSISLADIKGKHIGIVKGDANLRELTQAGFKISGAKDPQGLLRMLEGERFDLVISPVFAETELSNSTNRNMSSSTILFVANPYFFAVHKTRPDLARSIQKGLQSLHQDGSIDHYMARVSWIAESMATLESEQQEVLRIQKPDNDLMAFYGNNEYWLAPRQKPLLGAMLKE